MEIKLAAPIQNDSIVDGEGIRTVIWTQGCSHNCKGCHNPETHDFNKGFIAKTEEIENQILSNKNQDGITLSGGDPFFQPEPVLEIAKFCKKNNLNVWCYTGFEFENLLKISATNNTIKDLLGNIDVLIDGKFEEDKKSLQLHFKGSKNQRILNVKESLKLKVPIEIEKYKKESELPNQIGLNKETGIYI